MRHFINYIKNDDFKSLIEFGIKLKRCTFYLKIKIKRWIYRKK